VKPLKLLIETTGEVTAIYSDALADLCDEGAATITRASHVEPVVLENPAGEVESGWAATMNNGIMIGPFRLRQTALDAEVDYLERILLGL
jgi:hypothetical protein